jgi:PEP-CTERM motif
MKIPAHWLHSAIVVIAAILFSAPRAAFADSYTIYDLGDDNAHGIYGIDTAGDVVIWGSTGCGVASPTCYVTYVDGVATSDSSTAPILAYDDGTSCGSSPAGFNISKEVCNNGWVGFGSFYNPNGDPNGVYTGSGSSLDFLGYGSADHVFLNSVGDFAWVNGQDDEILLAIRNSPPLFETTALLVEPDVVRATTPEPGALVLFGTGLFLFVAAIRRKANRPPVVYFD